MMTSAAIPTSWTHFGAVRKDSIGSRSFSVSRKVLVEFILWSAIFSFLAALSFLPVVTKPLQAET
jgi:hypothetical protein